MGDRKYFGYSVHTPNSANSANVYVQYLCFKRRGTKKTSSKGLKKGITTTAITKALCPLGGGGGGMTLNVQLSLKKRNTFVDTP